MKLLCKMLIKIICGVLILGLLIFLPAGSLNFWQGWLFLAILTASLLTIAIFLYCTEPELLKSRLELKERLKRQNILIGFSAIMFIASFTFAGLNHHSDWCHFNSITNLIAAALLLVCFAFYGWILHSNKYISRSIKIVKNQSVIKTGPYRIVRHPMYSLTIITFLLFPILLDSPISLLISLAYPFLIVNRIHDEENFLAAKLKGYKAYQKQVKWRLFPYIY